MSTLTIRLPDDTHARMKVLARHRAMSVNKLWKSCAPSRSLGMMPTRFRALAARGSVDEGLRILDRLDAALGAGDQGGVKPTHPFPHHPGRRRPQRFGRTR